MLYTVLIYGVDGVFERLPKEHQEAHLAKHVALQEKLKGNGTYVSAARLMGPGTSMTVQQNGEAVAVTDGPFAETKEQLLGFYLIDVETMEEALEAAKGLPAEVASMEVRPVMWFGTADGQGDDG